MVEYNEINPSHLAYSAFIRGRRVCPACLVPVWPNRTSPCPGCGCVVHTTCMGPMVPISLVRGGYATLLCCHICGSD